MNIWWFEHANTRLKNNSYTSKRSPWHMDHENINIWYLYIFNTIVSQTNSRLLLLEPVLTSPCLARLVLKVCLRSEFHAPIASATALLTWEKSAFVHGLIPHRLECRAYTEGKNAPLLWLPDLKLNMADNRRTLTSKLTIFCRNVHGGLVEALMWYVRHVLWVSVCVGVCVCDVIQIVCLLV
jgi:hypothetical protein